MASAFRYVANSGKLLYVGLVQGEITFNDPEFHRREITLFASRNATSRDFRDVIAALEALDLDDGTDHFQPSNLEITAVETSSKATNVIPGAVTIQLNIRFNNLQRGADLVELVRTTAEAAAPGTLLEAKISGEAFLTPPGPIYDIVSAAIEAETGIVPTLATNGGTSDGRFLIALCPVVDFGLPNASMHKVGESAAIADIEQLSRIYQRVIERALG